MALSAQGTITATSATTFAATFTAGTETHTFVGSFTPAGSLFVTESKQTVLTYNDPDDLKDDRAFAGELGISVISLLFSNKATMKGPLKDVRPAMVPISGTGSWS